MPALSFRRTLTNGKTGMVYIADSPTYDPALDTYEQGRVQPGDILISFVGGVQHIQIRNAGNTSWDLFDWNLLLNKPSEFNPTVHDLAGNRHTGNLPITSVDGHTLTNTVHVEILAAALLRRSREIQLGSAS